MLDNDGRLDDDNAIQLFGSNSMSSTLPLGETAETDVRLRLKSRNISFEVSRNSLELLPEKNV